MSVNKRSLAVVSTSNNTIEVVGITNDKRNLGHIFFDGRAWSTWSLVDSNFDSFYKTAPSAVSTLPGSFDVFVTTNGDRLITRHFDGTSGTPDNDEWKLVESDIANAESAIDPGPVLGSRSSQWDLYVRETDASIVKFWSFPEYPDEYAAHYFHSYAKSAPINIITGSASQELFYIGLDDHVYHHHWLKLSYGSKWEKSKVIGDQQLISPPTVATIAPGRVDVFGIAPDQSVVHNSYQNSSKTWAGWTQLGTRRFASSISAIVPQGSNQIELWGLGTDGALWHRGGDGDRWPLDWDSHKASFISAPALVSSAAGVFDVFAIGTDGAVKHARYIEPTETWIPGYREWNSLGGSLYAFE